MTTLRLLPLVAVCAAACAAAGLAHAAPTQADLERIRLYGDVSIAQDSVGSWGVWEQFEPPAAGPLTPTVALPSRGEIYRPLGSVTTTSTTPTTPEVAVALCGSGSLCGFGLFYDSSRSEVAEAASVKRLQPQLVVAPSSQAERFAFVTRPEAVIRAEDDLFERAQAQVLAMVAWEPSILRMRNEALNGGSLPTDTGPMYQDGPYYGYEGGQWYLASSRKGADDGSGITQEAEVARMNGVFRYTSGNTDIRQDLNGYWGVTTSATGMSELLRGNVVANYQGRTDGVGTDGLSQTVTMTIDFGQSKVIAGQFGAGVDGTVVRSNTPSGTQQLSGQVGFTFTGDVVGSTFRATNLQAADATAIRGAVQGAFFGSNAQVAAGVADVVKSKAGEGGYTDARHTDTFITYKVDPNQR